MISLSATHAVPSSHSENLVSNATRPPSPQPAWHFQIPRSMLMLRLAEPSSWNGHLTIDCVPRNETPGSRFSKYLRIASGWKDVNAATPSCPVRRRTFGNRSREGASSAPTCERGCSLASCRFAHTESDGRHLQISGRRRCSLTIHKCSTAAWLPPLHEHFGLRIEHVALAFLPVRQAQALAVLFALTLFA